MSSDRLHRAAGLAWIAAVAAGLVAYALWNNPVRYAMLRMQPLATSTLFLAACVGFGWAARSPDFVTAAAVGIGILGAIIFTAGLLHLLHPSFFVVVLVGGVALFAIAVLRDRPWKRWQFSGGLWATLGWAILTATLVLILPFVVAPDTSTDALEYHLLIPRIYLEQNAIPYLPLLVESNYPSLMEYVYLPMLALDGDVAAKSFHFLTALLALTAIAQLVKRVDSRSPGILAAALFFSMPLAALSSGWAWNDLTFTLFLLLSLIHLSDRRFVFAGLLFGLATWTKYTFVLVSIPFAAILIRGLLQRWWAIRDLVRFAVPVVAIVAIWATKNAVLTGNPVYPFLNPIFGSPYWNEAAYRYLRTTLTRFEFPAWEWSTYLRFPVLLTLKPRVVDVHTGPLALLLLPLAFVRGADRTTSLLRTYAIGLVAAWLLIRTEARSLLSLLAVLSVLYASAVDSLPRWRVAIATAIATGAALTLPIILVMTNVLTDPSRYFLGLESRGEFVRRMEENQKVYDWLDAHPGVQRVLLVGIHDPFNLAKPSLFSSCCDKPIAQELVERHNSVAGISGWLKAQGITHIAVDLSEYRRENVEKLYSWSDSQREVFRDFLSTCRPVATLGDVVIFEVR